MVPKASLESGEGGLVPAGSGWFVLNVRDARWLDGHFGAYTRFEGNERFPGLGFNIGVLQPGQPSCMYHGEEEQEDFLVLSGEAIAIIEGQERRLKQWDFVHCPPGTKHAFAGAGEEPCVLLCAGSRRFQKDGPWGSYCADETAARHNASPPEDTEDGSIAYARFAPARATRYREGLLPG